MPSDSEKLRRWFTDSGHHIAESEAVVTGMSRAAFEPNLIFVDIDAPRNQ
jgi:hypothetical protein